MGNDLVERLRSAMCPGSERCNVLTCYPDCECGAMEAAAARIEALEEALTEITTLANYDVPGDHILHAIDVAENALRRAYANKGEPT